MLTLVLLCAAQQFRDNLAIVCNATYLKLNKIAPYFDLKNEIVEYKYPMDRKKLDITTFIDQVNNFIDFDTLNVANAETVIKYVKDTLFPLFIQINYEHLSCLETKDDATSGIGFRIIMWTKREKANFGLPIVREANGVILLTEQINNPHGPGSYVRCRVLARPACECNSRIGNPHQINSNIRSGCYNIYLVEDGTTVNLHYLQRTPNAPGKWVFSTKKSFDVSEITWRGAKYGDLIAEALVKYPGFSFDNLDVWKTYTIGFRHPAHHIFLQPTVYNPDNNENNTQFDVRAWFIQSTHNVSNLISYNEDIGLPTQTLTRINAHNSQFWQVMNQHREDALERFKEGNTPFLGYVLRSKDRLRTRHYSDILIESNLLTELRKAIYQLQYIPNKTQLAKAQENFRNLNNVILQAYLDSNNTRAIFEMLFPQYRPLFGDYDIVIDAAVNLIYDCIKEKTSEITSDNEAARKIAVFFHPMVESNVSLDDTDINSPTEPDKIIKDVKNTKKLIRSLIVQPKYIDQYYHVMMN